MADQYRKRAAMADTSYVFGSAVPVPEMPVPEEEPRKRPRGDSEIIRDARVKVEERARAKRKAAGSFSAGQTAALAVMAAAVVLLASAYILELSGIMTAKSRLYSLEKQITAITEENALLENARERDLDLAYIYEYATAHGMQVPEKQQVITYIRAGEEYVIKDGDIPNE